MDFDASCLVANKKCFVAATPQQNRNKPQQARVNEAVNNGVIREVNTGINNAVNT